MINSLDEAIKHYEEKAEELERRAEEVAMNDAEGIYQLQVARCKDCASEHRQLANLLKELKAYRKAEKEIEQELVNWNDIDNGKCRGLYLAASIIQNYKNEEVNADD